MRAYSLDLHERVVGAIDAGMRRAEVAATFRISERTINHYPLCGAATGLPLTGQTRPGCTPCCYVFTGPAWPIGSTPRCHPRRTSDPLECPASARKLVRVGTGHAAHKLDAKDALCM
jgi:hypothetical protein